MQFAYCRFYPSFRPRSSRAARLRQKICNLTTKATRQSFKHVGAVHARAIVVKPKQGGVRHAGFLPQTVEGPSLLFENTSKLANNHGASLAAAVPVCKASVICNVFFTYMTGLSNVTCSCESIITVAAGPPGDCHFSQVFALRIQP
jgi:hypothetical protein